MVAGSNCCDPYGFHFFRGRKDGLFEGRRRVNFQRDDKNSEQSPFFGLERGTTRPIIVDWNHDGHADILLTYRGHKTLHILSGGPALVNSLLNLPVVEGSMDLEFSNTFKDVAKWKPVFKNLEIPEFERLVPPSANGQDGKMKIGLIGEKLAVMERPVRDWIEVADWDGDGDVDLLVNMKTLRWSTHLVRAYKGDSTTRYAECPASEWRLYWLRNRGLRRKPEFEKPRLLYESPIGQRLGAFAVTDRDGDGDPEIVAAVGTLKDNPKYMRTNVRFVVLRDQQGVPDDVAAASAAASRSF